MSRLPRLPTFTSAAFLTLSTFFAIRSLVDLFHSTATSRVSLQGFYPLSRGMKLVAPRLPSRRFPKVRLYAVAHIRQLTLRRPQGFAPSENPNLPSYGYSPQPVVDPLLVFPPPGFLPKQRSSAFTPFAALHLLTHLSLSSALVIFGGRCPDWLVSPETAYLPEVLDLLHPTVASLV